MARLRSQNVLDQNEVMLDSLSPGTSLPYLLTTSNVEIKEFSSYFNQIIRCSGPNPRLSDWYPLYISSGVPGGSSRKKSTGDTGLISGSRRSPGEGKGYPLQYSCLANSMDREAWWAIVRGVEKSRTSHTDTYTETHTHTDTHSLWGCKESDITHRHTYRDTHRHT